MRKWLLQIHMYLGLAFFGFLIVFALSSLCFNHKPAFMENGKSESTWAQPIHTGPRHDPWDYAAAVQSEVGLAGRILHPVVSKSGVLKFDIARPGRRYTVRVSAGIANLYEFREGWIATLVELHGVRPSTSSWALRAWAWYSVFGAVAMAVSTVTGVLLWAVRRRERLLGWSVLGGATAIGLAICIYLRSWG